MPPKHLAKQAPALPPLPDIQRGLPLHQEVDIPELRSRLDRHASTNDKTLQDSSSPTKLLGPAVSVESHPRRPFSPTNLALKSGKTIKAFFRHHRHSDSLPVINSAATLGVNDNESSSPLRRRSTQAKKHESFDIHVAPLKPYAMRQLNNDSAANDQTIHRSLADRPSEVKVDFPRTEEKGTSAGNVGEEAFPLRQPRRSLSFFRDALKGKSVTKIVSPPLLSDTQNAKITLETTRRQRPLSTAVTVISSPCSDRPHPTEPEKTRPLTRLPATHQAERFLDMDKAEGPSVPRKPDIPSRKVQQQSLSVKDNQLDSLLSTSTPDPGSSVHLEPTSSPDHQQIPLTSQQSAITSITVNLDSDPDREAHYLLRMACTYLTKTILPELKTAIKQTASPAGCSFSSTTPVKPNLPTASERADALRANVQDKIKLIQRMEKAWGIEWMLRGKDGFTVNDARKAKERDTFRRAIDDGVVLCL